MLNLIHVDEIIQVEVASLKRILKIKKDIIVITDEYQWDKMFPTNIRMKDTMGETRIGTGYVFINMEKNQTYKDLKDTLAHELLHIKYPSAKESQIVKMVKNYIY